MAKKRQPTGVGICDSCGAVIATFLNDKIFNPKNEQIFEKCSTDKCSGHIIPTGDDLPF